MAVYEVQGPDGGIYEVEVPDSYNEAQVMQAAAGLFSAAAAPNADQIGIASTKQREHRYRLAEEEQRLRDQFNPTGSFGQNLAAGAGKSMYDTARGIGQLAGLVSEDDVAESRKRDQPLMQSGGGLIGNIGGYGAQMIAPGAIAGMIGKGAQGANLVRAATGGRELASLNAVANTANAVRSATMPTTLTGNVIQGGALGYLQPVTQGESRAGNAALGATAGAAGYAIPGVIRGGKALFVDPLTDKGNERILGRMLQQNAQNVDNLTNPSTVKNLPGYQPTLAEATLDPGIARLQRTLQAGQGAVADSLQGAFDNNNAARVAALKGLAGEVPDAVAARANSTRALYEAARSGIAQVDDEFLAIAKRPSVREGLRRAKKFAAEEGIELPKNPEQYTGQHLQYVDQALSDQIKKAKKAGANHYASKLTDSQAELRAWMERQIPEYSQAQAAFREASLPVDQAKIAQEVYKRSVSNTSNPRTGTPILNNDATKGATRKLGDVAKAAGVQGNPNKILSQTQKSTLAAVRESLDRATFADRASRATGSNTAQNAAGMNALQQMGMPQWAMSLGPVNRLATIIDRASAVAGVPDRLQAKLAELVVNPAEAQRIIMALPENDRSIMARAMQFLSQQNSARLAISANRSQSN